jgi:hypothetical protein
MGLLRLWHDNNTSRIDCVGGSPDFGEAVGTAVVGFVGIWG